MNHLIRYSISGEHYARPVEMDQRQEPRTTAVDALNTPLRDEEIVVVVPDSGTIKVKVGCVRAKIATDATGATKQLSFSQK